MIPEFPNFKKLELSDKEDVGPAHESWTHISILSSSRGRLDIVDPHPAVAGEVNLPAGHYGMSGQRSK